ncbi:vWA domain-containing protein [Virgibacillus siamensis]|uniref:vWA domain-containing protein n=1 Tax=Virgibacillus siamensis TaxID=480071 RepID=UPI00098674FB|nr:VWA domain-containing protein [Virgibacillus siamensis]
MKFNRWDDSKIDTDLYMQLQDLTTVLSNQADLTFEYRHGSFIDFAEHIATGSHHWDVNERTIKKSGYKSDVFLRALGTLYHSDLHAIRTLTKDTSETKLPKFSVQLFTLLEDLRLENIIINQRPGTKRDFTIRHNYLNHYFETQRLTNVTRGYPLDELFCLIYLLLQADQPDPSYPRASDRQLDQLETLKPLLYSAFDVISTKDVTGITERVTIMLEENYKDMFNTYFAFPITHHEQTEQNTLFDELTRTDPLENNTREDADQEDSEYIDETFPTWHRENQNSDRKQTFLQFELESGTKTSIKGGSARETEDGDQAMAEIQGSSGKSEKNDFPDTESLDKENTTEERGTNGSGYGEDNQYAVAIDKYATVPTPEENQAYEEAAGAIEDHKRRLATTIEKVLEHKMNAPRKNLLFGRLSKNLLPVATDENPRIFYKKNEESQAIDAAFTLLVDCSASMHNKMDETKLGITLFHEVLNQLKIPHSVIGFWEEANDVREGYYPNYFHHVHQFKDSFYKKNGAAIMQLKPQEDNRDGFSIRIAAEQLAERREKHKFLLVFSDGEPAAVNYDQNGIIDTNVAVSEARKRGIDVIGMFLSEGEIDEREDSTMQNIYGKEHLMIPGVNQLPEHFAPLLKRLLLRTI